MRIKKSVKKSATILGSSLVFFIALYFYFENLNERHVAIQSFKDCVNAGYPLLKTYPERCKMPGKTFENPNQTEASVSPVVATTTNYFSNYKNASYSLDGTIFSMKNGVAELYSNDDDNRATTSLTYFGNEVRVDLNEDKETDTAFLVTSTSTQKKSKQFFYIVAAFQNNKTYTGSNAILLGENITPISTHYENGSVVVRFTNTLNPSKIITRYFTVIGNTLRETVR